MFPARLPESTFPSTVAGQCFEVTTMETIVDLVVHNGTVVSAEATFQASVAIKDGTILAVGAAEAMPAARETLDATGLHLLPGAIDDWLAVFAQSFLAAVSPAERPALLAECVDAMRPTLRDADGRWTADYVRLRFAARR